MVRLARAAAARLATAHVIGDHIGVAIDHHALEACIRAHVLADLLAHEAGVAPGGERIEQHPERLPRAKREAQHLPAQRADRREVADEGKARPQRDHDPEHVLGRLQAQLACAPRIAVQADAGKAVALHMPLDPHEDLGVHRLRTRVAAEQPPRDRREEKQRERGDHQQHGKVDHVLRPQHQAKDIELARAEIEQHGLAAVPLQPGHAIEEQLGQDHHPDPPARERARHRARIDLAADFIQGLIRSLLIRRRDCGLSMRRPCGPV